MDWFKHTSPILFSVQCPRRCLEIRACNFGTRNLWNLANPLPIVFFVFVFSPKCISVVFFRIFGSEIQKFRQKNKPKTHSSTVWQGLIEHVWTLKIYCLSPKNGVGWTFVRKSAKNIALPRIHLISVCNRSWALNMTWYWPYAVRSSIFCAKLFNRHALD